MTYRSIPAEIETTRVIVASEPIRDTVSEKSWRITGRTLQDVRDEADKLSRAASEDGYIVFTMPKILGPESGPLEGWIEITGISRDLL